MIKFNCLIFKENRSNIWFILDIFQRIQLSFSSLEIHYALEYYLTEKWDTKFLEKKNGWKKQIGGYSYQREFLYEKGDLEA